MNKIIVYGTGSGALKLIDKIQKNPEKYDVEIISFTDSSEMKIGTTFFEKKVIAPNEINDLDYDYIIVASVYYLEIRQQLINQYYINAEKIIPKTRFLLEDYTKKLYKEKYGEDSNRFSQQVISSDEKIVVYTANIGKYDSLQKPLVKDENVDYVCFTDDKNFESDFWKVKHIINEFSSSTMCARFYKMHPHKLFSEYEYSIWVDSKYIIMKSLRDYVYKYYKKNPLLCFPHPERNNIFDEAQACIKLNKVNKALVEKQLQCYREEGLKTEHGLIDSGCLVRAHNDIRVIKLMDDWWCEVNRHTMRDQISFPYIVWKNKFDYDICDLVIGQCEYLQVYTKHEKI